MTTASCVLIVPADARGKAKALASAMGWGPENYAVPLSPTGSAPATHYGLHAWVEPEFVDILSKSRSGIMPAALTTAGFAKKNFDDVISNLTVSIRASLSGHFNEVIAGLGLAIIAPPPPV